MRCIHQKGMRGKSNVITKLRQKHKVKIWGARYTLGARYLSKNTVLAKAICFLVYTGAPLKMSINYRQKNKPVAVYSWPRAVGGKLTYERVSAAQNMDDIKCTVAHFFFYGLQSR